MSVLESLTRQQPQREAKPRERWLRVVPRPEGQPSRAPFVILVVVILSAGLIGLLLLNTTVQQGAFTMHDLKSRTTMLEERQAALEQRVAALRAPDNLANRAGKLGMVPNTNPVFLRLSDGAVLGDAVPAKAPETPKPPKVPPTTGVSGQPGTDQPGTDRTAGQPTGQSQDQAPEAPTGQTGQSGDQAATGDQTPSGDQVPAGGQP